MAWSLAAFGAVYPWAAAPIVVGAAVLAVAVRPAFGGPPALRALDMALGLAVAVGLAQLVPLPPLVLDRLSPHVAAFDAAYRVDAGLTARRGLRALALSPSATAYATLLAGSIVLLFWSCRTALAQGGARRIARGISWLGLAASLLAIVQRAVSPGRIYGWWTPLEPGAQPFGPMVNRNHFATWLLLALPVTVGYLVAHVQARAARWRGPGGAIRQARALGGRAVWLAGAGLLMLLALVDSRSRAAVASLIVAGLFATWLGRGRAAGGARWTLVLFLGLAAAALAAWANLGMLLQRFDDLAVEGSSGRLHIWRATMRVIRDFWLTGVGLGGYDTAMVVYQDGAREVFFNHAHNQYLQGMAEGGLLLALPAAVALLAFWRAARAALLADRSPMWHVRAGALAGIVAVAVQSLWESGLLAPANAVLLAVAAALVLHRPPALSGGRRGS